jgi:hypothetical protein
MHTKLFEQTEGAVSSTLGKRSESRFLRELPGDETLYYNLHDLFREKFCGLETVEKVFTLPDGTKLFENTPEVRAHAFRSLLEKITEYDGELGLWKDKIVGGRLLRVEEIQNWVWIYHPETLMRTDLNDPTKLGPISIRNLRTIDEQLISRTNGSSKYIRCILGDMLNDEWLDAAVTPGWTLMTKDYVPNTTKKTVEQQQLLVDTFARGHELTISEDSHLLSPSPVDLVLNAHAANMNGNPYLKGRNYERTMQRTTSGDFVCVGNLCSDGVSVEADVDEPNSSVRASVFR